MLSSAYGVHQALPLWVFGPVCGVLFFPSQILLHMLAYILYIGMHIAHIYRKIILLYMSSYDCTYINHSPSTLTLIGRSLGVFCSCREDESAGHQHFIQRRWTNEEKCNSKEEMQNYFFLFSYHHPLQYIFRSMLLSCISPAMGSESMQQCSH
jgi:hypothetical protein